MTQMIKKTAYFFFLASITTLLSCGSKQSTTEKTEFTKIDSLTENYLLLQDSLLYAWNVMVRDENQKIEAMHNLLHLMKKKEGFDKDLIYNLEQRLEQLNRIRFTQKSLANSYVIDEYDFASNSLVTEILSLAEADPEFINSETPQNLIDRVKLADQRVITYRSQYDMIAQRYNQFIERNKGHLKEIDKDCSGEKKALFQSSLQ